MNLILNRAIRSKTTMSAPILFGEPQYDKCNLFSYSIYGKGIISEVRFIEKRVVKHFFDIENRLINIEVYDQTNTLIIATKFEVRHITDSLILFHDWTNMGKTPNIGSLRYDPSDEIWKLSFNRRYSFLGYRTQGKIEVNTSHLMEKESYFTFDSLTKQHVLKKAFINQYEMVNKPIEEFAAKILRNGWDELAPFLTQDFQI